MFRLIFVLWCGCFAASAWGAPPAILVFGDSLSAGYGLDAGTGWVSLLDQKIHAQGLPYTVVNASVSGETTAGGLARLPEALDRHHPAFVLVELGGNDGLRGLPIKQMKENLEALVDRSKATGAQVLVFEMRIPSNYGPAYTDQFAQAFTAVASAKGARVVPFFLTSLVLQPDRWFQDDRLHPNAAAQPKMLDAVWAVLGPALVPGKTP